MSLCQAFLNCVTELLWAGILVEFTILKHEETTEPDTEMFEGKGVITGGEAADESYYLISDYKTFTSIAGQQPN